MKMQFRGWGREQMQHNHDVAPVKFEGGQYQAGAIDDPLEWRDHLSALGRVSGLGLNGSFLVEFTFEDEELKNWLMRYCKAKPEAALRLLAKMQAEATIALSRNAAKAVARAQEGTALSPD